MDFILEWLHIIEPQSQDSNGVMCEKKSWDSLMFCIKIIHYYDDDETVGLRVNQLTSLL